MANSLFVNIRRTMEEMIPFGEKRIVYYIELKNDYSYALLELINNDDRQKILRMTSTKEIIDYIVQEVIEKNKENIDMFMEDTCSAKFYLVSPVDNFDKEDFLASIHNYSAYINGMSQ
ncbi:hypothetical protein [Alkaliphilus sp. B6464]|uniref:hypothetical protein n=1 Tax=Alkaliphilus sp. B6464 TaxID=2731219 RepID=UPI001BABE5C2|nr:hypothetical protein [Alkaliphilus sp. B6464]QUH21900.1 hypothetical protein HYG84_18360 [Alkaliphilus sp. B6464]